MTPHERRVRELEQIIVRLVKAGDVLAYLDAAASRRCSTSATANY